MIMCLGFNELFHAHGQYFLNNTISCTLYMYNIFKYSMHNVIKYSTYNI